MDPPGGRDDVVFRLEEGGWVRLVAEHPPEPGPERVAVTARNETAAGVFCLGRSGTSESGRAVFSLAPFDDVGPALREWKIEVPLPGDAGGLPSAVKHLTVPAAPLDRNREVHVRFDEEG